MQGRKKYGLIDAHRRGGRGREAASCEVLSRTIEEGLECRKVGKRQSRYIGSLHLIWNETLLDVSAVMF